MTTGAAFIWGRSWIRDEIIVGHLLTHQAGIAKMATCTRIVNPTMVHVPWICRRLGGTVTVVAPKARRCSQAAGIGWCNQTLGKGAVMDHVQNLSTPTRTGDRRGCVPMPSFCVSSKPVIASEPEIVTTATANTKTHRRRPLKRPENR